MVVGLIILAVITVGVETKIDTSLIESSGFLDASLLGWQLIYILPVAVLTNDFFISGFWMRTFASKTDKDLVIGTSIATVAVACILALVGSTGLLAAWSGAWPGNPPQGGSIALFLLLGELPAWVVGIILVMVVSLSTAAFDSFQSAMVSTGSNDLFRNRLNMWWIRAAVVLVIFPVVVVALKSPDILQVFLISDLVSASSIPVLVLGLSERFYWWRGFEVVVGGLGGLLTVFIFGTIYFGDAHEGAYLLLLENGLYANDWSTFGKSLSKLSLKVFPVLLLGMACAQVTRKIFQALSWQHPSVVSSGALERALCALAACGSRRSAMEGGSMPLIVLLRRLEPSSLEIGLVRPTRKIVRPARRQIAWSRRRESSTDSDVNSASSSS